MGTKTFKITPKHRRFVQLYYKLGNAHECGRIVGFSKDYSNELLRKPRITQLLRDLEFKGGLSDEFLLRKHIELTNCGERSVELGALRLGYQVKKKIGSDDAPPPAVLPAVVIEIKGAHGATVTTKQRALQPDGQAGVSISRPHKP